jgi:hypothetical protein
MKGGDGKSGTKEVRWWWGQLRLGIGLTLGKRKNIHHGRSSLLSPSCHLECIMC